jgi:hypothetical protein
VIFVAAVVIVVFFRNNSRARQLDGGQIEFSPARIALSSWLVVLGGLVFIGCRLMLRAGGHLAPFASGFLFCVGVVYFLTMGLPGKIVIDDRQIAQTFWLGASETRILWDEIEEVQEQRHAISIVAPGNRKIVHWSILPDRPRLLREIELHHGGISGHP